MYIAGATGLVCMYVCIHATTRHPKYNTKCAKLCVACVCVRACVLCVCVCVCACVRVCALVHGWLCVSIPQCKAVEILSEIALWKVLQYDHLHQHTHAHTHIHREREREGEREIRGVRHTESDASTREWQIYDKRFGAHNRIQETLITQDR